MVDKKIMNLLWQFEENPEIQLETTKITWKPNPEIWIMPKLQKQISKNKTKKLVIESSSKNEVLHSTLS